jgi:D-alanine-D-alanine ligase
VNIGFTYDLRADYLAAGYSKEETAEFDSPVTIDGIAGTLESFGHRVDRIGNIRALTRRLAGGDRWDLVFNIAEGLRGLAREAQVPALLEAWDVPYVFSDPLTLALCLDKGMCKRVIQQGGLQTAGFQVVESPAELDAITLPFPLFLKPVAEGTSKGIGANARVRTQEELRSVGRDLLARHGQAVLVETFLPGREFTVGMLGTGEKARVLGVMEVVPYAGLADFWYSSLHKEEWQSRVDYRAVDDAEARAAGAVALAAWRLLRCRDGGRVDLRSDANGKPCFMEVNPLAGLNPEVSDLVYLAHRVGWDYPRLLAAILESAVERVNYASGAPTPLR